MRFLVWLAAGLAGGLLGGMGMGGGTVLIPILTVLCGVPQHLAQSVNLLSFLPMAALSLPVHARDGLLDARALRSSGLTAALPVYYAALAAFVLISPRLYLAANRASLRRGEEHLRAAPV